MPIVILCSSVYSESACAMAVRMAQSGYVPAGALTLSTLNRGTLLRKLGQWGVRDVARYARAKLIPSQSGGQAQLRNPYLEPALKDRSGIFRTLREVASAYAFPVAICSDQNSPDAISLLKAWSPDLIIFTGGNILSKQLLEIPRLGVLNVHLGLLPEIRGMSSPEWSLLQTAFHSASPSIPWTQESIPGRFSRATNSRRRSVRIAQRLAQPTHRIRCGQDGRSGCRSRLRHDLCNAASVQIFSKDNQFFVMHEWLQQRAAERLTQSRVPVTGVNGECGKPMSTPNEQAE
jgi:hypothetical protein